MIKLHPPKLSKNTVKEASKILKTNWLSTSGKNIINLEKKLSNFHNTKYCCATINGTSALDLAIKSIQINDAEIITTSISWISTVNTILYNNLNPIFLNVDSSLNLNLEDLQSFLEEKTFVKNKILFNKKTKKKIIAIVYTNLYGKAVDIKKMKEIIKRFKANIYLIEDAAESLGSFYPNSKIPAGSLADISCLSFNANKIITASFGGAILTNNKKLYSFCSHKANQCKIKNFDNDGIGYNYKITNLNATILLNELKLIKKKILKKKYVLKIYKDLFKENKKVEFLNYDENGSNNWLINIKINLKKNINKKLIKYLNKKNIEVRPIFNPFTNLRHLKKFETYKVKNINNKIKNCISIPSGPDLKYYEIKKVSEAIMKFVSNEKN